MLAYRLLPDTLKSPSYMHLKILDVKELSFEEREGVEFHELSDIAYRDGTLFGVSDRGYLYKMQLMLERDKIKDIVLLQRWKLKGKRRKKLKKKRRDAEGLAFFHKNLLISFERKHRVDIYDLHGEKLQKADIHTKLQNRDNYIKANKGLESVAYSEKYGIVTAPERPLQGEDASIHTIYGKDVLWRFRYDGSITAVEFRDDHRLLVLLRKFNYFTRRRISTLLSLDLRGCEATLCQIEKLAVFDSDEGFHLDNFEGLTKISKNRYLMISDDNGSFLQKTLVVLFAIRD